jgi:hypothetical protein
MSLKPVYVASSEADAHIVRHLMEGAGIEAALRTDDGHGLFPSLDLSEGVAVMVDEGRMEEAKAVLEEYLKGATAIEDDDAVE